MVQHQKSDMKSDDESKGEMEMKQIELPLDTMIHKPDTTNSRRVSQTGGGLFHTIDARKQDFLKTVDQKDL